MNNQENQKNQDNNRRFGGISRLYGENQFQLIQNAHICVVGVGGVGSWAVEALARSGVGELTLIDLDNIAISNTNRQLHALTPDFGKPKVQALRERIAQINPNCVVHEIEDFVDEHNLNQIFINQNLNNNNKYDFVIDAIDQMRVKVAMIDFFIQHKQRFIISGSAGGQKNPALIQTADLSQTTHDPLLSKIRATLRKKHGFPREGKMRVPCVYSLEQITPPQINSNQNNSCEINNLNNVNSPQGLSCAGYGASMLVTASFGLHCASAAIESIINNPKK